MKVFVLLMCTVASTAASNAVAWPGAVPLSVHVKTILPPQISGFGYSTSQYINAIPPAVLHQPQFGYQIGFPGYQPYQPVISGSYHPSNSFLYPSFAPINQAASGIPFQPPQAIPTRPAEEPAGDEDTSVIDSADFSSNQQQPSGELSQSQLPQLPQNSLDSKNMPSFPQIPQFPAQIPNLPQIPSLPQFPQQGSNNPDFSQLPQLPAQIPTLSQIPSLPQFPQPGSNNPDFSQLPQLPAQIPTLPQIPSLPQFPQPGSNNPDFSQLPQLPAQIPTLPQIPSLPQFPQPGSNNPNFSQLPQVPSSPFFPQSPSPPPGFPSADNSDQSLNDEDTVSIDAA